MSKRSEPFWKAKQASRPPQPQPSTTAPQLPPGRAPIKVLVCVFTGEERHGWVCPRLTSVILRMAYDPRLQVSYAPIHAVHPVCAARNLAVNEFFLKSECERLVIFDNDVAPPDNVADAIVSMPDEVSIAVFPYWVWLPDRKHTMPCFGFWENGVMIIPDPTMLKPGWQKMGAGGTGAMVIKKRVFTDGKLTAPWFKIISTADKGQIVSEDVYFTGRAAEAGHPTWLNTDFICSHFHTVDLAEINLGTVLLLKRFTDTITKKYGDHGLHLKSLIQELQPEMAQAASKLRDDVDHAKEIAETDAKNVEFNRAISLKAIQDAKDEDAAKANFDAGN